MRVFVTGGSGFVGSHLIRELLAAGHEVFCLSRSGEASVRLADMGAEVLSGDLSVPETVVGPLREARPTHVAHLASERRRDHAFSVNVAGTQALVRACRDLQLHAFLHLSSLLGGDAGGETLTEDSEIPQDTPFGESQAAAETIVGDAWAQGGLPAVTLRTSRVYGAGGWLADLLSARTFRIPGTGENWWDLVHVDDVTSACMFLLERAPVGETFHIADDEPLTMKEFFEAVATASGRKPFGHVPTWMAKLAKENIVAATRSAKVSNAKLKALGWSPAHPAARESVESVIDTILQRHPDAAPRGRQARATEPQP